MLFVGFCGIVVVVVSVGFAGDVVVVVVLTVVVVMLAVVLHIFDWMNDCEDEYLVTIWLVEGV